jgi:hypothetical protein
MSSTFSRAWQKYPAYSARADIYLSNEALVLHCSVDVVRRGVLTGRNTHQQTDKNGTLPGLHAKFTPKTPVPKHGVHQEADCVSFCGLSKNKKASRDQIGWGGFAFEEPMRGLPEDEPDS